MQVWYRRNRSRNLTSAIMKKRANICGFSTISSLRLPCILNHGIGLSIRRCRDIILKKPLCHKAGKERKASMGDELLAVEGARIVMIKSRCRLEVPAIFVTAMATGRTQAGAMSYAVLSSASTNHFGFCNSTLSLNAPASSTISKLCMSRRRQKAGRPHRRRHIMTSCLCMARLHFTANVFEIFPCGNCLPSTPWHQRKL